MIFEFEHNYKMLEDLNIAIKTSEEEDVVILTDEDNVVVLTDEEIKYGENVVNFTKYIWNENSFSDDVADQIIEAYSRKFGTTVDFPYLGYFTENQMPESGGHFSYKIHSNDDYMSSIEKVIVMFHNKKRVIVTIHNRLTYNMREKYNPIANEIIPRETKIFDFNNQTNVYDYISSFSIDDGFLLSKVLLFEWIEHNDNVAHVQFIKTYEPLKSQDETYSQDDEIRYL
jgi:hypothetical protein